MSAPRNEYSYGIVAALRSAAHGHTYLLVRQADHWGFPKGHREGEENPVQTARRELREECGVSEAEIIPGIVFRENYSFGYEDTIIEKENMYFLATVTDSICHPQEGEILECGFFSYEEARARLTYGEAKRILEEAQKSLLYQG